MKYRKLGYTGLDVSELCLGGMSNQLVQYCDILRQVFDIRYCHVVFLYCRSQEKASMRPAGAVIQT